MNEPLKQLQKLIKEKIEMQMNELQRRCPIFQRQAHFTAGRRVYLVRSELMGSTIRFYNHSEFAAVVYLRSLA